VGRVGDASVLFALSHPRYRDEAASRAKFCGVCLRSLKDPQRARTLDFVKVCKPCRNGFANRRQLAFIVDGILFTVVATLPVAMIDTIVYPDSGSDNIVVVHFGLYSPIAVVNAWIVPLLFFFKDGFTGMSPGKRLMGVQVVDADTLEPIGFGQSFKRNIPLYIPFVWLYIALTILKGRRLGDRRANTQVIWRKFAQRPAFDRRGILCIQCGYDLTGNVSGRCPECFTPIGGEALNTSSQGGIETTQTA
jgi:uncharacterized RDD family membrane protein YckC